jgi:HAD superfamily hydrolase (TIGR01509 family)
MQKQSGSCAVNNQSLMNAIMTTPEKKQLRDLLDAGQYLAALFDFDGVLGDTLDQHYDAWKEAIAEIVGLTLTEGPFSQYMNGAAGVVGLFALLKAAGRDQAKWARFTALSVYVDPISETLSFADLSPEAQRACQELKAIHTLYFERYAQKTEKATLKPLDGVVDFLKGLKSRGFVLGIVSSSHAAKWIAERMGVAPFFDVILTGHDVGQHSVYLNKILQGKPDPDVFFEAAHRVNVPPEKCIGFGDALNDIVAMKQAGVAAVGVDTARCGLLGGAVVVVPDLVGVFED